MTMALLLLLLLALVPTSAALPTVKLGFIGSYTFRIWSLEFSYKEAAIPMAGIIDFLQDKGVCPCVGCKDRFNLEVFYWNDQANPIEGVNGGLEMWLPESKKGQYVNGIVGPLLSSVAVQLAGVGSSLSGAQIAFAATDPKLNDKSLYPYFSRTMPDDNVDVIFKLLQLLKVTKVSIITVNEPYARGNFELLASKMVGMDFGSVILPYAGPTQLTEQWSDMISKFRVSSAGNRVWIHIYPATIGSPLLDMLKGEKLLQPGMIHITSEATAPNLPGKNATQKQDLEGFMAVTVQAKDFKGKREAFEQLYTSLTTASFTGIGTWLNGGAHKNVSMSLTDHLSTHSPGDALFEDIAGSDNYAFFAFDGMCTFLRTVDNLLTQGKKMEEIRGELLVDELRKQDFDGITGRVKFNAKGQRESNYQLMNMHNGNWNRAAWYYPSEEKFEFDTVIPLAFSDGKKYPQVPSQDPPPCAGGSVYTEQLRELGACLPCTAGRYANSGMLECMPCAAGRFASANNTPTCTSCDVGQFSDPGSQKCSGCLAGSSNNARGEASCKACSAGSFAAGAASKSCSRCPAGTYQANEGQSSCMTCGVDLPGSSTQLLGSTSSSDCLCLSGLYYSRKAKNSSSECAPCPTGLECPDGNGPPLQAEGYYATAQEYVGAEPLTRVVCDNAVKCPVGRALSACPTALGGLACNLCEVDYKQNTDGSCSPCADSPTTVPIVLYSLGGIVFIGAMYHFTTKEITVTTQIFATAAISFGITINMVLVLGAFSGLSVEWIEPMESIIKALSVLTFRIEALNPGCIFHTNSPVLTYVGRLMVFPIFVAVLLVLFGVSTLLGRVVDRYRICNAVGLVSLLLYLSLAITAMLPWQCQNNPDGTASWSANKAVLCWDDSQHVTVLALSVLAILAYVVTFISLIVWATLQYPRWVMREGGLNQLRAFFFLFLRFTPQHYYYGVIYIVKNLLLAVIPVCMVNEPVAQVMLLTLVVIANFGLQCQLQPWRNSTGNLLDSVLGMTLAVIITAGALLLNTGTSHGQDVLQAFLMAVFVVILIVVLIAAVYSAMQVLFPRKKFGAFLVHHKAGGAVLARWFKLMFGEKSGDAVFLDSDELDRLDLIFQEVAINVRNLVVLLTLETLSRMWCAGEITSGVQCSVNIVIVACNAVELPNDQFLESLGDVWSVTQKNTLAALGIEVRHIQAAYLKLRQCPVIIFDRSLPPTELEKAFDSVYNACNMRGRPGAWTFSKDMGKEDVLSKVLISGNVEDQEATCICQVMKKLLIRQLRQPIAVTSENQTIQKRQMTNAVYMIVVLTQGVLGSVSFVTKIVTAIAALKVDLVPIIADTAFIFPEAEFWLALQSGTVVKVESLAEFGMTLEQVVAAYKKLTNVLALRFSSHGSQQIQGTEIQELSMRFRALSTESTGSVKALPTLGEQNVLPSAVNIALESSPNPLVAVLESSPNLLVDVAGSEQLLYISEHSL